MLPSLARCCLASAGALVAAKLAWVAVPSLPETPQLLQRVVEAFTPLVTGCVIYALLSWLLGSPEVRDIAAALTHRFRR